MKQTTPGHSSTDPLIAKFSTPDGFSSTSGTVKEGSYGYKARWVVKGYEQQAGVDFNETFASVVKPMSYKALFATAAARDFEIEQMDVKTALLYGSVEEEIYVYQPEGFDDGAGRVCRLNKALYGLKQSPRVWYQTLSDFLIDDGFEPLNADSSVFVKGSMFGPDIADIEIVKAQLGGRFSMTNLGPLLTTLV